MGCLFTFSLGLTAGLDFALSWGWCIGFPELLDMFSVLIYFVLFHDVCDQRFHDTSFFGVAFLRGVPYIVD